MAADGEMTSLRSAASSEEMSETPLERDALPPVELEPSPKPRRTSFGDEQGGSLKTVYRVTDTHYKRPWLKRHRNHLACLGSSLAFGMVLAIVLTS